MALTRRCGVCTKQADGPGRRIKSRGQRVNRWLHTDCFGNRTQHDYRPPVGPKGDRPNILLEAERLRR